MRKLNKSVWPYSIYIPIPEHYGNSGRFIKNEIDAWCIENHGRRFVDWYGYNVERDDRLYAFKTEADLLVFKLRWNQRW